ncbi:GIN domain-containing protein [Nitrospirillum pindoramense]|uniref:Putative autotransporter adhesin-like protein n=1 Tax=Nitrospirillum amazonense TaxID=28077 RepID=A0A560HFL8_9PROT|nr:DUF2807 domain-containing protein [Nitrospirillum amazonense]TWB45223.1 putative autotransporter adhesin-like protein [Nitrospirillum amazonense]
MSRMPHRLAAAFVVLSALPLAVPAQAASVGPQTLHGRTLELEGLVAHVEITVSPSAKEITVTATGDDDQVNRLSFHSEGDKAKVEQEHRHHEHYSDRDFMKVSVTLPAGTALSVDDFVGDLTAGDLNADLAVADLHSGSITVGRVQAAALDVTGSGDITVGDVAKAVSVEIKGSGKVRTGKTSGAVSLEISGSGNVDMASVNGAVSAEIHGSGNVTIHAGKADPLSVDIAGSGDFTLDGVATNQSISQHGSGQVHIRNGR